MAKVYYRPRIEGVNIPGIIHNMSYFFDHLSVYENGVVNCWQAVDLEMFRQKLESGWVVTSVPKGRVFSIYDVGAYELQEAEWVYDNESFYAYVKDTVKKLNPEMKNIYEMTSAEKEKYEKYHQVFMADGHPFKVGGNFLQEIIEGENKDALYLKDGRYCITTMSVFKNGFFQIDMEGSTRFALDEIIGMIENGTLYADPGTDVWIEIENLVKFKGRRVSEKISTRERIKEITEWHKKMIGKEDALNACRRLYHEYLENPSDMMRKALKKSYEAVPEHERMFLGDMDSQDSDYVRIIYHPEQKREV